MKVTCPTCGGRCSPKEELFTNEAGTTYTVFVFNPLPQPNLTKMREALDRFDSSIEPAEDKWPILYIAIEDFLNELEKTKL